MFKKKNIKISIITLENINKSARITYSLVTSKLLKRSPIKYELNIKTQTLKINSTASMNLQCFATFLTLANNHEDPLFYLHFT